MHEDFPSGCLPVDQPSPPPFSGGASKLLLLHATAAASMSYSITRNTPCQTNRETDDKGMGDEYSRTNRQRWRRWGAQHAPEHLFPITSCLVWRHQTFITRPRTGGRTGDCRNASASTEYKEKQLVLGNLEANGLWGQTEPPSSLERCFVLTTATIPSHSFVLSYFVPLKTG